MIFVLQLEAEIPWQDLLGDDPAPKEEWDPRWIQVESDEIKEPTYECTLGEFVRLDEKIEQNNFTDGGEQRVAIYLDGKVGKIICIYDETVCCGPTPLPVYPPIFKDLVP